MTVHGFVVVAIVSSKGRIECVTESVVLAVIRMGACFITHNLCTFLEGQQMEVFADERAGSLKYKQLFVLRLRISITITVYLAVR